MKRGKKIIIRRSFSEEYKRTLVNEFESGNFTVLQLSRLHNVGFQCIYNWIRKYSTISQPETVIIEMKKSSTQKLKQMEKQIKELHQILGQKQIKLDYLEKIIDLSNQHYKTDLKKNFNTQQS